MSHANKVVLDGIRETARFIDYMNGERARSDCEAALKQAFNKADVDSNGRVGISDRILREQVLRANRRSATLAAFANYDLDGDRVLTDAAVTAFATHEVRVKRVLRGDPFGMPA